MAIWVLGKALMVFFFRVFTKVEIVRLDKKEIAHLEPKLKTERKKTGPLLRAN